MDNAQKDIATFGFFAAILMLPISISMRCTVLYWYWLWFVVPLGAPILGWAHLYGLGGLVSFLLVSCVRTKDYDSMEDAAASIIFKPIVIPVISLLFGYVTHLCM